MSRRNLTEAHNLLEKQIIETMLAERRYPESFSDMQGCVRNLLRMFDVKRRPLAVDLEYETEPQTENRSVSE